MKRYLIIWDFDGTILPLAPHDSEQTLLMHMVDHSLRKTAFFKRLFIKTVIFADNKEKLRKIFKKSYHHFLKGVPMDLLEPVSQTLANQITRIERQAFRQLKVQGHHQVILSCGTWDLSTRILKAAGLRGYFDQIEGNRFRIEKDKITGMELRIPNPEDKLTWIYRQGFDQRQSVVVGDGYTDLPLFRWAEFPVLLDRTGKKKMRYPMQGLYVISSIFDLVDLISKEFCEKTVANRTNELSKSNRL